MAPRRTPRTAAALALVAGLLALGGCAPAGEGPGTPTAHSPRMRTGQCQR